MPLCAVWVASCLMQTSLGWCCNPWSRVKACLHAPGFWHASRARLGTLRTAEDVEDVRREVQIMHHLEGHPNIVKIVGAFEDKHSVHLVRPAAVLCLWQWSAGLQWVLFEGGCCRLLTVRYPAKHMPCRIQRLAVTTPLACVNWSALLCQCWAAASGR